ncbi:MAG: rRNA methyltransferase [Clostridia bacterium]|nr:rRNA methyltransferase [Clostridia bacterium]
MELPIELRNLIEEKLEGVNIKELQKNSESVSLKYRDDNRDGRRLVTEEIEALAYAAVRMPATYGAVSSALKHTFEICDCKIESVLDVGAGTGAGTWAVCSFIDFDDCICLEREDVMRNLGKSLMQESEVETLKNVKWEKFDLVTSDIKQKADLVICSYVLNELSEENRLVALDKLWKATNKILLIIEPGTPIGFSEIKELRKMFINKGGCVIAPCPNIENCPMLENDWCHTTCRVARTKIHKLLKNGNAPYEDEKFSYIAVSKDGVDKEDFARVLRHPKIESGKITLQVCTNEGIIEKVVTKKDKELFKVARKASCGDRIEI